MTRFVEIPVPTSVFALFFLELVLIFGGYTAAVYADPEINGELFLLYESGLARIGVVVLIIVLGLYFQNLYDELRVRSRIVLLQQLCVIIGIAFITQALLSYLAQEWIIPRSVMTLGSAITLVTMFVWRLVYSVANKDVVRTQRILFLGMTPTAARLAQQLSQYPEFGFTPIGYLANAAGSELQLGDLARLGSTENLDHVIDLFHPESLVIAKREEIRSWWVDDFLELGFGGVQTEGVATLYEAVFRMVCIPEMRVSDAVFTEVLMPKPVSVILQAVYSRAIAGMMLVITLPVMVFIAALIKLSSPGPVLLRQQRSGLNGAPFAMYCFRWTHAGEALPRPTVLGKWLRKLRVYALPQFFNVLLGQMCVVGPEPLRPPFAQALAEWIPLYKQRQSVRPGMTGWAQLHSEGGLQGQNAIQQLAYDLYYTKNLSPSLDLFVMLRWVKSLFQNGSSNALP